MARYFDESGDNVFDECGVLRDQRSVRGHDGDGPPHGRD
jgi:hypothetical protein